MLPAAIGAHQAHEQRGEAAERAGLRRQWPIQQTLEALQGRKGGGEGFRQLGADGVAIGRIQGGAHPSRHRPGGMDLAASQPFDQVLAELAQADAAAGQLRVGGNQAEDVALGGIAIPAQQEIGAAQMKKRQRMGLGDLGQVQQPPQLLRHRRDRDRQDPIAGLGGGQQVAHRADAADAGGDRRHLGERPPLAERLKAPVLHHMEAGALHGAGIVQLDGDLGVAFDPRHRVDQDGAGHGSAEADHRRPLHQWWLAPQ